MKKFLLTLIVMLFVGGIAFASVNVMSDGTNLGPAQDVNFTGGSVSGKGPLKTVALGTASITSGTISGAAITGSTVNSSVVGGATPAAGTFTTLTARTSLDNVGAAINWTDATIVTQNTTWSTDSSIGPAAINWTALTADMLKANTGINWSDVTGL